MNDGDVRLETERFPSAYKNIIHILQCLTGLYLGWKYYSLSILGRHGYDGLASYVSRPVPFGSAFDRQLCQAAAFRGLHPQKEYHDGQRHREMV